MGNRAAASAEQIADALKNLEGWEVNDGKLQKTFKFKNFGAALGWMVAAGIEAEKMNHHPEWSNVYNRVSVSLVTHDLGNVISTWDIELAEKMESLA